MKIGTLLNRKRIQQSLSLTLLLGLIQGCGTNTDVPVFPLYTSVVSIGVPAITSLSVVEETTTDETPETIYQYDLKYFVTNQEDSFSGYNLYISTSSTSENNISYDGLYLPEGTEPSFIHTSKEVSTRSADVVTKRISHYKAPPSPVFFQVCEIYYFRLQAVTREGLYSNMSPQVSACAVGPDTICPSNTPCYVAP